ncbi:MAG: glycosyltransferase [Candidatus Bathyarchaeia archaeon]
MVQETAEVLLVDVMMWNTQPKVTIAVATYDRSRLLAEALRSVQNQKLASWECIVVNDGGDDVSSVVASLGDDRFSYVNSSHVGMPNAVNIALKRRRGKYIAYLGDDDLWYANHLELCARYLDEESSIGVVYTKTVKRSCVLTTDGARQVVADFVDPLEEFYLDALSSGAPMPIISVVHRSDLLERVGLFKDLPIAEDLEFLLRLASITEFAHIPIITSEYFVDIGGESRSHKLKRTNPQFYGHIMRSILNEKPVLYRHRRLRSGRELGYLPEGPILDKLFGSGVFASALKALSYYYIYSRRWGSRAALRRMARRMPSARKDT